MSIEECREYFVSASKGDIDWLKEVTLSGTSLYRAMIVPVGTTIEDFRYKRFERFGHFPMMSTAFEPVTCLPEIGFYNSERIVGDGQRLVYQEFRTTNEITTIKIERLQQIQPAIYADLMNPSGENRREASVVAASGIFTNIAYDEKTPIPIWHPSVSGIAAQLGGAVVFKFLKSFKRSIVHWNLCVRK